MPCPACGVVEAMEEKTISVPAIHCGHCVATIKRELSELPGVAAVAPDLKARKVAVKWGPPATWEQIKALLSEIGFPPAEA